MNKNTHNNDDYACFDSIIIAKLNGRVVVSKDSNTVTQTAKLQGYALNGEWAIEIDDEGSAYEWYWSGFVESSLGKTGLSVRQAELLKKMIQTNDNTYAILVRRSDGRTLFMVMETWALSHPLNQRICLTGACPYSATFYDGEVEVVGDLKELLPPGEQIGGARVNLHSLSNPDPDDDGKGWPATISVKSKLNYDISEATRTEALGVSYHYYKIWASKNKIARRLGIDPIDCKGNTRWMWRLKLDDMHVFTIYDMANYYKPSDEEPLEFHVGWHSSERLNHEFPAIELSRALEERGLWISR